MAKVCDICGKGPQVGNTITTRGKAKYLGGVGTKITGINRRKFKPNLQRVRVTIKGVNQTIQACTRCIRSGYVTKLVKAAPFRLPTGHSHSDTAAKPKPNKNSPVKSAKAGATASVGKSASGAKGATSPAAGAKPKDAKGAQKLGKK